MAPRRFNISAQEPALNKDGTFTRFWYNAWDKIAQWSGEVFVRSVSGASPISSTGGETPIISLNDTAVTPGTYGDSTHVPQFTVDVKGRLTAASDVVTALGITQLTGDVTAGPGSGSQAATLANSGVTAGTYGDATHSSQVTIDAKGRVTSASSVVIPGAGGLVDNSIICGRLTTESGVPVSIGDRTAQATIYFTPYNGNQIALYTGSAWAVGTFSELSLALSSLTSANNYDVFIDYNGGTPQIVLSAAWTNDTTRSDALALQDGIYVKSGTPAYRHVGTIRTTSTTTTEDSLAKRFVWNRYNQVVRSMARWETAATWNYTTATWRQANANTANQLAWVTGDVATAVSAMIFSTNSNSNATGITHGVAFGLDSTSVPNATGGFAQFQAASGNQAISTPTGYSGQPGLGYHFLAWLEASLATATTSWGGQTTFAGQTVNRGGLTGTIQN